MESGPSSGQSGEASVEQRRVTVQEATRRLGISEHAVRQRIRRGTLGAERDEEGRVYVYLSAPSAFPSGEQSSEASGGQSADTTVPQPGYAELLEEKDVRIADLQQQLEAEREARRRADHIIAALTERIPELEAPPHSAQEAESVAESASGGESPVDATEEYTEARSAPSHPTGASSAERRPWWRRIFGV